MNKYVIAYDVGTTSLKTCLYELGDKIRLLDSHSCGYHLEILDNGGVEQDPNEWWHAMCITTKGLLDSSQISADKISGISFCAQMQGFVLVDKECNPVCNAMSYLDNRAKKQMEDAMCHGIKIEGLNVFKTLKSVRITGLIPASTKDAVWKYNWVKENEPEIYKKIYKWLDVKEYLVAKACGEFVLTEDNAYATMLYDIRKGKRGFSRSMCRMLGVDINHLPKVVKGTDIVGQVSDSAAKELGLSRGTSVFGGGGDASIIGIGAGATNIGDTHIYMGTSGWVSTVVDKPMIDIKNKMASIVGANKRTYNYFAELETGGKCIEWVKEHLAYEETIDRLGANNIDGDYEDVNVDLYGYMMRSIKGVPAGSNSVIFTPWLHGNRCPFEDSDARGMFFNIGINTTKKELIHSVMEGVCYHLRWMLECSSRKVHVGEKVRLVGGGALSSMTCQILADILGKQVEVVEHPQNAGAMGAAILMAVGFGKVKSLDDANSLIEVKSTYYPNDKNRQVYDKQFEVFKCLYQNNKKAFKALNSLK